MPEVEIHEEGKNLASRLQSDMRTIYRSKQSSDLVAQIDAQTFHLHSALLSVRCPALLALIQSGKIQTENLSLKQMEILVDFIYEDQFKSRTIFIPEMAKMHALATKLDLPYLASLIEHAVADILEPKNLVEAASAFFEAPSIQKR